MAFFYHPFQTGSTALYLASQQGHNDVVKLLFEFGASTEFQSKVCSGVLWRTSRSSTTLAQTVTECLLQRKENNVVHKISGRGVFGTLTIEKL